MNSLFRGGHRRLPRPVHCGPAWAMMEDTVAVWEQAGGLLAWLPEAAEDVAFPGQGPINGPISRVPLGHSTFMP